MEQQKQTVNTTESDRYCSYCESKFSPEEYPSWANNFCTEQCSKYAKRSENPVGYLKACNVPSRYVECTFENFRVDNGNMNAFKALSGLKIISDTIYISGDVGTGKTHLSVALARNLRCSTPERANFQRATAILLNLRAGFSKDGISEKDSLKIYQDEEILIIDDLGAEKLTDYVIQAWYSIVDYRYSNMLPTVITSNLSIKDLAARFGDRIASRVASGMVLTLKGDDRRLNKWR